MGFEGVEPRLAWSGPEALLQERTKRLVVAGPGGAIDEAFVGPERFQAGRRDQALPEPGG